MARSDAFVEVQALPGNVRAPTEVAANPAFLSLASSRRVLLLQGPLGPFYRRLSRWLSACEKDVCRIVLQGGDARDTPDINVTEFRGRLDEWSLFLVKFIEKENIDTLVLFGQAREYHAIALGVARFRKLKAVVLEEGYFRPGFVTMELDGVNAYSRTLDRFRWKRSEPSPPSPVLADCTPHHFRKMAFHAIVHYINMWITRSRYKHYQHHREPSPWHYVAYWLRTWGRKALRYHRDREISRRLIAGRTPYFLVPLQNDGDSQITHHSTYGENSKFIFEVTESFAGNAPTDVSLVFRVHPFSRGGHAHRHLIASIAEEFGISERIVYLTEGPTPELAQHSRGVIVINSTVGLQVLERGAPLMAMGEALYKRHGLTFSGPLDRFWSEASPADPNVVSRFLDELKNLTQMPASIYANSDEPLRWPVIS